MRRVPALILTALLSVVAPAHLHADPISLSGSGVIEFACSSCAQRLLGFTAAVGDPFTVLLNFDPGAADQNPSPDFGDYSFGPGSFSVTVPSGTATFPVSVFGQAFGHLLMNAGGDYPVGLVISAAPLDGHRTWPSDLAAALNSGSSGVWVTEPPGFHLFFGSNLHFTQTPDLGPVPEPTTILLLGTGLVAAARRRWRQPTSDGLRKNGARCRAARGRPTTRTGATVIRLEEEQADLYLVEPLCDALVDPVSRPSCRRRVFRPHQPARAVPSSTTDAGSGVGDGGWN